MTPDETLTLIEKLRALGATSVKVGEVSATFAPASSPQTGTPSDGFGTCGHPASDATAGVCWHCIEEGPKAGANA